MKDNAGNSRGFGFVDFTNHQAAVKAVRILNNTFVGGLLTISLNVMFKKVISFFLRKLRKTKAYFWYFYLFKCTHYI